MLVISRKIGEALWIGDNIRVTVVRLSDHAVRLGIDAPVDVRIMREELAGTAKSGDDPKPGPSSEISAA